METRLDLALTDLYTAKLPVSHSNFTRDLMNTLFPHVSIFKRYMSCMSCIDSSQQCPLSYLGRGGVYELQLLRTALWAPHPLALRCHGSLDICARHGKLRNCRHSRTQPYIIRATCLILGIGFYVYIYMYICIPMIYIYIIYTYIQIFGVRQ